LVAPYSSSPEEEEVENNPAERVLTFLSLIYNEEDDPEGIEEVQEMMQGIVNRYGIEDDGEVGEWLEDLYDSIEVVGLDWFYLVMYSFDKDDEKENNAFASIIHNLQEMAELRGVTIDWGGDISDSDFRLKQGLTGLLTTAARSFHAQGYTLWRDITPLKYDTSDHKNTVVSSAKTAIMQYCWIYANHWGLLCNAMGRGCEPGL